jgi:S1-C subfamily serine protease
MRKGITIDDQRTVNVFVRKVMNKQVVVAVVILVLVVAAWAVPLGGPPTREGVVLVQTAPGAGGGSGVLVSSRLVVTASDIVGAQLDVFVSFPNQAPQTAHVLFADTDADSGLALLELPADTSALPVAMGDSEAVADGEDVVVIGYPGGEYSETKSKLVSRTAKTLVTDLPAHPGNSGGALLSGNHMLIGVVASATGREPTGQWAVPTAVIRKVCSDHGKPIQ